MNRRHALWTLGGAGAAISGYAWSERRGLTRADLDSEKTPSNLAAPSIPPEIRGILEYASLAPSGHNAQPWTVRVGDGVLRIGTDRSRWLPKVDPLNRELSLSIGAFLEKLLIAAPNFGYLADYTVTGTDAAGDELLLVQLKKTPVRPAPLAKLRARRTLRSGQLTQTLSAGDVASLTADFTNEAHFISPESREGRYLAEGTIAANQAQALRDEAQEELAEWIRWTNADGRSHRDGLNPESMEISGFAGWYVRHFMTRANVLGRRFRDQGVDRVREQVASCGGWIVITSRDSTLPSLIETGRRTERMWLAARDRLIAIHPMTQMLEEMAFQDRVASTLGVTGHVQFILRVGYVRQYLEPVSLRVPVSAILRT